MKIVVIGAVAAGTSAAAKARRNDDEAQITIYEKDRDISYSGCGLPYYIGGGIADLEELTPRNAKFFKKKYNIDIQTEHEVLSVDTQTKTVEVKNLKTGEVFTDTYDKLVIATGATPFMPNIEGIKSEHVFCLRNVENTRKIKQFIITHKPKNAVVVGTGFIGFEVLENLMAEGLEVTIVEKNSKITPNLDEDMAQYLEKQLLKKKFKIIKGAEIQKIQSHDVLLQDGRVLEADLVIVAAGVKPNITLAKEMGLEIGVTGAIQVNAKMETSVKAVYACGDCIELFSCITGKPMYRPLGSTANKTGRIAGDQITGGTLAYRGTLGTGIFKLFDLTIATTGLGEKEARQEGYNVIVSHNIKPNRPAYFEGKEMVIKAIADQTTQKLLGVQIVGRDGVDKRIDVFATLITYGATVDELFHLDLAYAPPFSTTKDPIHYTGMILDNAMNHGRPLKTSQELGELMEAGKGVQIIDARVTGQYNQAHVKGAQNMPHSDIRNTIEKLDKNLPTVTYCNKGVTGNAAQNILINNGFREVYNLSGGHKFYQATSEYED